jgi:hypothetical protein
MSLTKILSNEKTSAEEKLEAVAQVVAAAREAYGNADQDIAVPDVNTVHGVMPFNVLEDEAKVELLQSTVGIIKASAVEYARTNPGTNINRRIEELLATDGMFTNVAAGTKFEYI